MRDLDEQLEHAIALAAKVHAGQRDKLGEPYILHPLRVMQSVADKRAKVVAALHDVVEDTALTMEHLAEAGFDINVLAAVNAITHRPSEPRVDYYARVKANPLAWLVKQADIADNTSPDRMNRLDRSTRDRLTAKYAQALEAIGAVPLR